MIFIIKLELWDKKNVRYQKTIKKIVLF